MAQLVAWQALVVVLFAAPLWNAHRHLAQAEAALGREVGVRLERTVRALRLSLARGWRLAARDGAWRLRRRVTPR
jgi:hypothetical protein